MPFPAAHIGPVSHARATPVEDLELQRAAHPGGEASSADDAGPQQDQDPDQDRDGASASSRSVYFGKCSSCHGAPGAPGDIGPYLFGMTWNDAQRRKAFTVIKNGREADPVDMPAWGNQLSDAEIRALIDWIASQSG